ncbi:MAG: hypothetical protein V1907_02215 [Candidatus Kerfeldbacteria bacterium]
MNTLFGPPTTNPDLYESLATNGINAFPDRQSAAAAQQRLRQRADIAKVDLARLRLRIADNDDEIPMLHRCRSLIVIYGIREGSDVEFLGRAVTGRPTAHPLSGAFLWTNGLKPFPNFADAEYAAREAHRQAMSKATIAAFSLRTC